MPRSGETWDPRRLTVRPALEPLAELLAELGELSDFPTPEALGAWVDQSRQARAPELAPLHFSAPKPKPRRHKRGAVEVGELYDGWIAEKRQVPCLPKSYHDLFNALMFKAFPRSKRALHARQYEALSGWAEPGAPRLPGRRTREQDALTLFDEGGSVVLCPTSLAARFHEGETLGLEAGVRVVVFGHALLEHLSDGQVGLRSTARVLWVDEVPAVGAELLDLADGFVARLLADPERFRAPDADAVALFEAGDRVSFRRFDPELRGARLRPAAAG